MIKFKRTAHPYSLIALLSLVWLPTAAHALLFVPQAYEIGPGGFGGSDTLIDFDDLDGRPDLTSGEMVANQYATRGVTFANTALYSRANSAAATMTSSSSGPNVVWFNQGGGMAQNQFVELSFTAPVSRLGLDFFTSLDASFTLELFDSNAAMIEAFSVVGDIHGLLWEGFLGVASMIDIHSARIYSTAPSGNSFNFFIDNLIFGQGLETGTISNEQSLVSEPSALYLVAFGFLLAGVRSSQRRCHA